MAPVGGSARTRWVQWNLELFGELAGIERAASKVAAVESYRGNPPAAVVDTQHQFFGLGRVVDIHFLERNAPVAQELLGTPAVATILRTVDNYFSHCSDSLRMEPVYLMQVGSPGFER